MTALRWALLAPLVFGSSPALAASIGTVGVAPGPNGSGYWVALYGTLEFPSTGYFQLGDTGHFQPGDPSPTSLVADFYVSSPAPGEIVLDVLDVQQFQTSILAFLEPGEYSYVLNLYLQPRTVFPPVPEEIDPTRATLVDSRSGTFTLRPTAAEPSQLALLAAVSALSAARGISRRRPSVRASGSRGGRREK
jgi:hypothetical protein